MAIASNKIISPEAAETNQYLEAKQLLPFPIHLPKYSAEPKYTLFWIILKYYFAFAISFGTNTRWL